MESNPAAAATFPQVCQSAEPVGEAERAAARSSAIPLQNYVPFPADLLKIVCVNFHIFQDGQGQGNFQPSENARFRKIIDWVNARFAAPAIPSRVPKPTVTPPLHLKIISDTRIRFKIHRIEHYQIADLHELFIQPIDPNASAAVQDAQAAAANTARIAGRAARQAAAVARDPSLLKQLNIYISIRTGDGGGYSVMPSPLMSLDSNIVFVTDYFPQSKPHWLDSDFGWSMLVGHELGHCLDLAHTFVGGGASANCNAQDPDFLSDVFGDLSCPHDGAWDGSKPKCTNNLMGGTLDSSWISPRQAAMMQRALTEKSVRKYLATGCHDCGSCVAFAVSGQSFLFKGVPKKLTYPVVELNETWGWNGADFVAPVPGIYHFDLDFRREGQLDGDAVRVVKNHAATLALASASQGANFGVGSASFNARLERGDTVGTQAEGSTNFGLDRTISGYRFSGHLICGCP